MRLLSVDWDYFFPVPELFEDKEFLYDWGHAETGPFMLDAIWVSRASQFIRGGHPLPTTSGAERTFWNRFRFGPAPVLFYADSHSQIYKPEVLYKVREVWNFDAHHDAYDSPGAVKESGRVYCYNWVSALNLLRVPVKTIVPRWMTPYQHWLGAPKGHTEIHYDDGIDTPVFDKVFVCRSGVWTPTWIEDKFWEFLDACPIPTKVKVDNITRRNFDYTEVEVFSKQMKEAIHVNTTT